MRGSARSQGSGTLAAGARRARLLAAAAGGTKTVTVSSAPPAEHDDRRRARAHTAAAARTTTPTTALRRRAPARTSAPAARAPPAPRPSRPSRARRGDAPKRPAARSGGGGGGSEDQGYTPNDTSEYHPDQTLRVLLGTRTGSADGYDQRAFFFLDGKYIGTDASQPSASIRVVSQSDTEVVARLRAVPPARPAVLSERRAGDGALPAQRRAAVPLQPIPPVSRGQPQPAVARPCGSGLRRNPRRAPRSGSSLQAPGLGSRCEPVGPAARPIGAAGTHPHRHNSLAEIESTRDCR